MDTNQQKNAERFTGFADIYDGARPSVPSYPVKIIQEYLGRIPELVVDLGCGTGLSTQIWKGNCGHVVGIEPSADMRRAAAAKECEAVSFRPGYGSATGLESSSADVVVCSQSFHWMEPVSTLREIDRILKPGGIFAAIDCDWPPVTLWQAEQAYMELYQEIKKLEKELPDVESSFIRYPKDRHLANMKESGYFRYCRELLFSNTEECTAQRFVNLILSQGSTQTILKLHPEKIQEKISYFQETVKKILPSGSFHIDFSYRMRIGVKHP